MLLSASNNKEMFPLSKFLDFDKDQKVFYNNFYLEDFKIVIKMPLVQKKNKDYRKDVKIEKFDLTKYTYLCAYD
ncbi:MAG: hypothetical protein ACTSQJ_00190 [Promethearchaeota archaeon]